MIVEQTTQIKITKVADQSQTNRMSLEYDWSYISSRMADMVKTDIKIQFLFNVDIINLGESGPWTMAPKRCVCEWPYIKSIGYFKLNKLWLQFINSRK